MRDVAERAGFEIASPEEIEQILTAGAIREEEEDEKARQEGKRFLDEERDREIIDEWFTDAAKCASIDEACALAHRLMTDYRHDYGTICHAISAGILAMAWGMNGEPQGGITGFQSGAVMWGFVTRWMFLKGPTRLVQYNDLLYPQMDEKFTTISRETADALVNEAKEKLGELEYAHPDVRQRIEEIASGTFPAFITVGETS